MNGDMERVFHAGDVLPVDKIYGGEIQTEVPRI
jgi:hypothetical protein